MTENTIPPASPSPETPETASPPDGLEPVQPSLREILKDMPPEFGGPAGPEPTRYGDWEQKGRCTDF